jgi:hypothetical protein
MPPFEFLGLSLVLLTIALLLMGAWGFDPNDPA